MINIALLFWLCNSMKLLICFPLVQQSAKRHKPDFALRSSQQRHAVKE